jgi:hypothetical protein
MSWTARVGLMALASLLMAAVWSWIDDDVLFASVGLAVLGLMLLRRVLQEGVGRACFLAVLLCLPIVNMAYLFVSTE